MRRLSIRDECGNISLQHLTLKSLRSALADNTRGQSHFRSIGGLEVLLDGLGLPSNIVFRDENFVGDVLNLHVLSLEVLREAIFGNLNNLQFLCENGRIHKFANSFCSPAFMLQENWKKSDYMSRHADLIKDGNNLFTEGKVPLSEFSASFCSQQWAEFVVKSSRALASFLLAPEDIQSHDVLLSSGRNSAAVSPVCMELSLKWFVRVLFMVFPCIKACSSMNELPRQLRSFVYTIQHYVLFAFRKLLVSTPTLIELLRAESIWDLVFSDNFFYFGSASGECLEYDRYSDVPIYGLDVSSGDLTNQKAAGFEFDILQIEVVSFVEFVATLNGSSHNMPECYVLLNALEHSACRPEMTAVLAKSLLRILQLSTEKSISSFKSLDAISRVLKIACRFAQESGSPVISSPFVENIMEGDKSFDFDGPQPSGTSQNRHKGLEACMELFAEYFSVTDDAKSLVLRSSASVDCLFDLFWEESLRKRVLVYILDLMKISPISVEEQKAKLYLCSKYLEMFTHVKEHERNFVELSIDLLVGMRDMLVIDQVHYQALFRDGQCFLHVVSLLNGSLDEANGQMLLWNVLQTLTCLLQGNDDSKTAFRALVGRGYHTLQSLLLDFCHNKPSEELLNVLLDMLVDGKFDIKSTPIIKNEDVILLYLSVLQKSSDSLRDSGLNFFLQLLRESISNRASCVRAGMLNFLLDWFSQEENDTVILEIAQLIQVSGGYSISGKDIRKIFALLRSDKVLGRTQFCSLLLTSMLSMLNEKGPSAFFDLNGNNSGIVIKTPMQWPVNKGFSFSCWLRIENYPRTGSMGLFSFLTDNGRGSLAVIEKDKLIYESINQKHQCLSLPVNLVRKKWHFLCITHSIGRAFSGGSQLRCYVDGALVSSEKCRYAKVPESLINCTIGSKIDLIAYEEDNSMHTIKNASPFYGQIGPVYMFNDAITSEQVQGIFSLGPSYMYSFLDSEGAVCSDNPLPGGILDAKDGLASKIIFGLNAQASNSRTLFNVAPLVDNTMDKNLFEATVLAGTQLCSRRLLQEIIYCVGGITVFFPLLTQSDLYDDNEEAGYSQSHLLTSITKKHLIGEVIELIASVLDENLSNQQQMLLLSGFSVLGFLMQSVPPQHLNLDTLSALKHLFNVVANCGLSDLLVAEAISNIFLKPQIWVYATYKVQRELYMFLVQQFDNDPRLLTSLCRLPHVLDVIRRFYWDNAKNQNASESQPPLYPITVQILAAKPKLEEVSKIRLMLLSLGEMSLRQNISVADIKALIAFFETCQDMACIEDVLHMVIRAVSQKPLLASFLDQVNYIGGCHLFVNLLERDSESIRLLSLQFLGRLLVGLPSEKKGSKFFNLTVGRSKFFSEGHRKFSSRMQPIFSSISVRLFRFPQTDVVCATLFDVLLGGASPKQVLQKHGQLDRQKSNHSQFFLPQILVLIFEFLSGCEDNLARIKIIGDLLELLESNPSNIEALMENGWNAWLIACTRIHAFKSYNLDAHVISDSQKSELSILRSFFCVVHSHYIHSVKGGWQQLEESVNFLLMQCKLDGTSYGFLVRDIYEDLVQRLINLSSGDNIFMSQPCRDNTLYLLKLVDEMLLSETDHDLLFTASSSNLPQDILLSESQKDLNSDLFEALKLESEDLSRNPWLSKEPTGVRIDIGNDGWWILYDNLWIIIGMMHGKVPGKPLPKPSSSMGPSFSQRARGLVESLNIPAAEMAAVVVSGGISNALGGKSNRSIDKAMMLRAEKCPRIVFRLLILYLCRASLQRASQYVQQIIPLLPYFLAADDEQSKSRLQLFIWRLLSVKLQYGSQDDGARFHVIAHLIRETINYGKSMLASSITGKDDSTDSVGHSKETVTIQNLIQKDRVLSAVADELKYKDTLRTDRSRQLHELQTRMDENASSEANQTKAFELEIQNSLSTILSWDDNRRASYQTSLDENQQVIAGKWIHMVRSLIDERGPWSANPFPNSTVTHWKLDKTEDSWRRRPKLRRNYHFNEKLCQPLSTLAINESNPPINESKFLLRGPIPEKIKWLLQKRIHRITDESFSGLLENHAESSGQQVSDDLLDKPVPEVLKDSDDKKDTSQGKNDLSSLVETESSEVLLCAPCVLVATKRKLAGRLIVMRNAMHFSADFIAEGTGGSTVFKTLQTSSKPDQIGGSQNRKFPVWPSNLDLGPDKGNLVEKTDVIRGEILKNFKIIKRHRRWNISKVKAVHWTRYLLRYTAIEIFFNDSIPPVFLNFASQKDAKDIGTLIVSTRNEMLLPKGSKDKTAAISFVDRRMAQEMAETARETWRRREMTNFEYLMILNTLAGRSYNDLTQYPVFPWVLADYSSEILDFNKASTFRDLSKPVGALDGKRLEVFEDRYRNFCDPDIPNFYYGSHYSSMGIVLFYLLRLEPFTSLHRSLQGGKFDHADRLFHGIEATYRNCLSNTSDVKELIPEFFYMPEFLVNSNSYHFGVKQDGEPLGDVFLPPWAKGSPEEFINRNREALESEYVSSNLHNWIDLVFGYKQRGKPAVEAANIFYYVTYEGAVDLEAMEDELQRSALEDQIANFGQTPIQIFRKKHPRRGPPIPIAHPLHFAPSSINLTSIVSSTTNSHSAIVYTNILDYNVILVNDELVMSVKMWLTTQLQSGGNFTFSSSQDPFFGIGYDVLSPRKIGSALAEPIELGAQCFATLATPSENFLVSCGNWENSFQITSLSDGRIVQSIRQHKDVVNCVAVSSDGTVLATGSYDTTVMVWEVLRAKATDKKVRATLPDGPRKDIVVAETPFHILCGHDDIITCLYVSVELDIIISGSKDGTCVFHTLRGGIYIRSLQHPSGCALSKLIVSRHGRIVLFGEDDLTLHLYSINGKHIASSESNGRLTCVELSSCGEFLVCAGDLGQIIVRSMKFLDVVSKYNGVGKMITSLAVTPEECFLAGTRDGNLLVYSIENPQLHKTSLPRNSKSKT
ncbi:BEACH domain-containing protein B isoform X2 [Impatiens glandulifera]|nr:BEACH domain-containing protein B isoform X2 [Impatiens glandulifera]